MTRDARSPDTAIRLGEIGISPGPHRPEFPTKPISPITLQHRYCPTRSDQVRRSRRQNRPIPKPQVEKYGGFRFQRKTRRRLYPTDKTRPPSARLLPSDRSRDRPLAAEPNSRQPLPGPQDRTDAGRTKPQSAVRKSPIASEPPRQTTRGNASLSSRAKPGFQRNNKSRSLSLRLSVRNGSKISRSYCAFAMLNSIDIGSKFGIDTSAPSSSLTEICITVSVNFRLEVSNS